MLTAYLFLLLACYRDIISPSYSYAGMSYQPLPASFLLGAALNLLPAIFLPADLGRPSDYASWFLYLSVVVPASFVVPLVMPKSGSGLGVITTLVVAYTIFELCRRRETLKVPSLEIDDTAFLFIMPLFFLILATAIFAQADFTIDLSMDANLYDRRLASRQLAGEWSLLGYLTSFALGVGVPFLVASWLTYRDWISLPVLAYVAVAIMSFEGAKSALFSPVLFFFVGWMSMRKAKRSPSLPAPRRPSAGFHLLTAFLIIVLLSLLEPAALGSSKLADSIVRRLLVMPAQLTAYYFDFWTENPLMLMGDGWLGRLGITENPYPYAAPMVIGSQYFGSPDTNANANVWAAAFAHFGYLGVFATSVAAAWLVRLLDSIAGVQRGGLRYLAACLLAASIGATWANCAFHTSLLTNGVLPGTILLATIPNGAGRSNPDPSPLRRKHFSR